MFCYQCQETAKNQGCTVSGVCGKPPETAIIMDLLVHSLKGIGWLIERAGDGLEHKCFRTAGDFIGESLFSTITNANFDIDVIKAKILRAKEIRQCISEKIGGIPDDAPDAVTWDLPEDKWVEKGLMIGVLATGNEDVRSLRELLIYGVKGIAAYNDHANILGYFDDDIYRFMAKALASTLKDLETGEMIELVLECGKMAVQTMALLDKANTETYGNPEITKVDIGVGTRPGILISGHDLHDMKMLLEQTKDKGIDIYTHSEMLPANYYPAFKVYDHFHGNYGNAWWKQNTEFESFNGPILMTTNCITPVKGNYKDRIFTTGAAGYPGVTHIVADENGHKDFTPLIEIALKSEPPKEIEQGEIVGGFAHTQVIALADKIVDAVKSGAIKRFVVMAGCDGRHKTREYFTNVAEALPKDAVILTAGCAKYRYNKLNLGDIGGIPRVLDAGQCNDSYSLAVIALKLKEVFGLDDINDLPISFDLGWYEQKAVTVLLALLYLGFKGIRLGPTLPAFLSPNVAKVLIENFDLKPIGDAEGDVALMMTGK